MPHPNDNPDTAALATEALFTIALTEDDEDIAWEAITELQRRRTPDIYLRTRQLCGSPLVRERDVGADILGQLARPDSTQHEESVQILLAMLEVEQHPEVLQSIGMALSHWRDPRAILPLIKHQHHADPDVRHAVACGMLCHDDPHAITALIALSADPYPHVRDWATFGLAVQIDTDTPEIRDALAARLGDADPDTEGEAMVGLACRHDPRVLQPLLATLESGDVGSLPLEAATALADPRLYPALVQLHDQWDREHSWEYKMLEEAIAACTPAQS
jgi:HEAT repeat protein